MNPPRLPIAAALFAQWQRARGGRDQPASRPFLRNWEDLLEDAGLVAALDRNDAERDARTLEARGWIEIKPVSYKPHLIDRIAIPLAAEIRWREAFGFVPPTDEDARAIRGFDWEAQLAFLRESRLNIPFTELRQLNDFLKRGTAGRDIVPIKERSLQIFGEEKRLDVLADSVLFREGRLDLQRDLLCKVVGAPLAWKRGPASSSAQSAIVIENAATWHSYARWNQKRALFSAVVYGGGNAFVNGVASIADIFSELGGPCRLLYFGDLDPQGLLIPQEASARAQAASLPTVEPHLWSYRQLLTLGSGRGQSWEGEPPSSTLCDWLGELAEPARQLFAANERLAQEHVGWEFLQSRTAE